MERIQASSAAETSEVTRSGRPKRYARGRFGGNGAENVAMIIEDEDDTSH